MQRQRDDTGNFLMLAITNNTCVSKYICFSPFLTFEPLKPAPKQLKNDLKRSYSMPLDNLMCLKNTHFLEK